MAEQRFDTARHSRVIALIECCTFAGLLEDAEAALNAEREGASDALLFVEAYARDGCHHLCSESGCTSMGRLRLKRAKEIIRGKD